MKKQAYKPYKDDTRPGGKDKVAAVRRDTGIRLSVIEAELADLRNLCKQLEEACIARTNVVAQRIPPTDAVSRNSYSRVGV